MPVPAHRVLVVEDDQETQKTLVTIVASIGMSACTASTLEEVDAAIAREHFCCVLLDKQIPLNADAFPLTATGDLAQKRLRAVDPRRTTEDHHVLPIIVLTGASRELSFANKMMSSGASWFIAKPFDAEDLTTQILAALARAGRAEHAACAALRPGATSVAATPAAETVGPAPADFAERVVVTLDGKRIGRRTGVLVNGTRCTLQDHLFAPFFRLAAERARGSEAYLEKYELGFTRSVELPSRIQSALEEGLPEGFEILQRGGENGVRLHPLVVVGAIPWGVFERHPHPGVQGVAVVERKRRG